VTAVERIPIVTTENSPREAILPVETHRSYCSTADCTLCVRGNCCLVWN